MIYICAYFTRRGCAWQQIKLIKIEYRNESIKKKRNISSGQNTNICINVTDWNSVINEPAETYVINLRVSITHSLLKCPTKREISDFFSLTIPIYQRSGEDEKTCRTRMFFFFFFKEPCHKTNSIPVIFWTITADAIWRPSSRNEFFICDMLRLCCFFLLLFVVVFLVVVVLFLHLFVHFIRVQI